MKTVRGIRIEMGGGFGEAGISSFDSNFTLMLAGEGEGVDGMVWGGGGFVSTMGMTGAVGTAGVVGVVGMFWDGMTGEASGGGVAGGVGISAVTFGSPFNESRSFVVPLP